MLSQSWQTETRTARVRVQEYSWAEILVLGSLLCGSGSFSFSGIAALITHDG